MMLKTHIAIAVAIILVFLPQVEHKVIFSLVALAATIIPDLDSKNSGLGKHLIFRIPQFFTKHRGVIHSLTVCILASFLLAFIFPVVALPFFVGYSLHLFSDSFTIDGIEPFWPYNGKSEGYIRTDGKIERGIFSFFVVIDLVILVALVARF
jgi:membrane-bound metal-dependent hydrolase YbcI (DUF457 family)